MLLTGSEVIITLGPGLILSRPKLAPWLDTGFSSHSVDFQSKPDWEDTTTT